MRKVKPRINITPKKLSGQSKSVSTLEKTEELKKRSIIKTNPSDEEDNFNNYILGKMKLK